MQYFIKTFGCQMNTSDSERLAAFLETNNFSLADKLAEADLVIFNTCGIKQTAENRAYSMINNLRKNESKGVHPVKSPTGRGACPVESPKGEAKLIQRGEQFNRVKIIMTGCLANRADVQKRMKNRVDLFTEIKNFQKEFKKTLLHLYEIRDTKYMIQKSSDDGLNNYLETIPKYNSVFSAYVPIMTGCNNFCAYCVVPHARGREVSRPAEEVIREIKALVKNGYKHIFLLGQNVNSYQSPTSISSSPSGRGCPVLRTGEGALNFPQLLKKINAIPGKFWVSFTSNHPKDVTDEMIETVAQCKKVCENFHLPIQAGNDEILKKMNRHYTAKDYLKTIRKIKSAFKKYKPSALFAISSDIIVGFPGETKKQFLDSAEVMKKAKFDMVYFGQFSPRPGTAAWKMKDNVSQKEKERREIFLNEILKKTALANNKKYLGEKIEVLVETCRSRATGEKEKNGSYFGKTRTGKNVKINSKKENLVGKIIKVEITKIGVWNLEGVCHPAGGRP